MKSAFSWGIGKILLSVFGLAVLGLSVYFAQRPEAPKKILQAPAVQHSQVPMTTVQGSPAPNIASSPEANNVVLSQPNINAVEVPKQEEAAPSSEIPDEILFTLHWKEGELSSKNWQEIKSELKKNHQGLTIAFLFPHIDLLEEAKFRQWIAVANYYILARRILLIDDTSFVLKKDPRYLPGKSVNTTVQGFVLLETLENKLSLTVRGFEQFPEELISFSENVILKALEKPEKIAEQNEISHVKMSEKLRQFEYVLSAHQETMTDWIIDTCTRSKSWKDYSEQDCFHCYLPLICLEDSDELKIANTSFCQAFVDEIVNNLEGKDAGAVFNACYYGNAFSLLRQWVLDAKFDVKIKELLFK